MEAKQFVDSLFKGYEETAALADFKEELLGNLNAKIESFEKKGMGAEAAFAKASAELGDVSALADELSLKKRTEVFEEAYMGISCYMPAGRVAGYVIFGVLALFGIAAAFIAFLAIRSVDVGLDGPIDWTSLFLTIMPFLTAAAAGFTFLGVTQETSSIYPVSKKRAAWYTAAAALIAFGFLTMPIVYFGVRIADNMFPVISGYNLEVLVPVIVMLIPFVLPGIGVLVFLVLTEKDRLKPWAKNFRDKAVKHEMEIWNDPATATRFGVFSGAIWIFAVGLFLLLGFLLGFKFSWLVFIFAAALQLLVQGIMSKAKTASQ